MSARVLSPDEARALRTRWVAAAWGLVWIFATLPVVQEGLAGGARGTLGAVCAVVSCASLYASCSLSLRRVRQGPARPGRLDPPLIVLGALAAAGAVAGVGEQGLQMLVFLTVALAFALPWRAAVGPIAVLGGILFLIPRTLPSWTASEGAWIALVGAGGICVFNFT
mgnify:FL=1